MDALIGWVAAYGIWRRSPMVVGASAAVFFGYAAKAMMAGRPWPGFGLIFLGVTYLGGLMWRDWSDTRKTDTARVAR